MNATRRGYWLWLALLLILGFSPVTRAATGCTISTTGVAFGTYDPTESGATAASGVVNLQCQPGCSDTACSAYTGVNATLTFSQGGSGSYAQRALTSAGGSSLRYNLYTTFAHSAILGDGSSGTPGITYCFTGSDVSACNGADYAGAAATSAAQSAALMVYGVAPGAQDVPAGSYSDTITATLTF